MINEIEIVLHLITNEVRERPKALYDLKNRVHFKVNGLINAVPERYSPLQLVRQFGGVEVGCNPELNLVYSTEGHDIEINGGISEHGPIGRGNLELQIPPTS